MPSARFAAAGDRAAIRTHMTRNVNGTSIIDELIADFGTAAATTNAQLDAILASGKILLGFDDSNVLRGVIYTVKTGEDEWEVSLIGADKRLTDQQRLAAMNFLLDWLTRNVPAVTAQTNIHGTVKVGGKIDTYMQTRLAERELSERVGYVHYQTNVTELQAATA